MATLDTILNIKVEGTSQMTQLKSAIDETSKQLKELKKTGKDANETQAQFNAKIVSAETKLKGLRGELNKQKSDLIKNAKAVGDNTKSYDSLVKQNANLSAQLRKLADPLGKNNAEFKKLSGQINTNTQELKKMDSAMGRSQRNVGNYGASITKMTAVLGGAILAFQQVSRAIGSFVDFEFAIKQVGIISGATAEEMALLSDQAKELGASTAFTAGEVAGLQKELAKLGFDPTEIQNMTSSILDLSFAFDIDLATASEKVGSVLKAMQLDASETARVTDVLAVAFSNSALDMDKFSTAFPKVGAVAKTVGFSLEDVTALMGSLADKGLDASVVGTSLRNIFLKMADPASDLSLALGGSVTSVEELIPALQRLQTNGIDVTEMLELTDKRSVTAFASILEGSESVDVLNEKLLNASGTTEEFADEMRDTLKGSLDELKSSANGLAINLVESLAPALTFLADAIGAVFTGINFLVENFDKVLISLVGYQAGVYASTIATAGFTGALSASSVGTIFFTAKTWLATYAQRALNVAMKASPIGLITGALAVGASMLMGYGDEAEEVTETTHELNEAMEEEVETIDRLVDAQKGNHKISKELMQQEQKQIAELAVLVKQIKDVTLSTKDRKKALKEYNDIANTNITNLEDENQLIKELDESYKNVVQTIKQKIIIQSVEEEMTDLIKRQLEIEKSRELAEEKKLELMNKTNFVYSDVNKQRDRELGILEKALELTDKSNTKQVEELENKIAILKATKDQVTNYWNQEEALNSLRESVGGFSTEVNGFNINQIGFNSGISALTMKITDFSHALVSAREGMGGFTQRQQLAMQSLKVFQAIQTDLNASIFAETMHMDATQTEYITSQNKTANSWKVSAFEAKLYKLSVEELLDIDWKEIDPDGDIPQHAREVAQLAVILEKQAEQGEENVGIERKLAELVKDKSEALEVLNTILDSNTGGVDKNTTAYEDLKNNVKLAKDVLTELVLTSDGSAESLDKIATATTNLENANNALIEGEEKLTASMAVLNKTTDDTIQKQQEQIDQDKAQIDALDALAKKNEDIAERQIELALKVAKAELDLYLQTMSLRAESVDDQDKYVTDLMTKITDFELMLEGFRENNPEAQGFLEEILFGKDEDGTAIRGEQFIESMNATFNMMGETLNAFANYRNTILDAELQAVQTEKDKEIDAFEKSAEYATMSEEEKTERIEEIEAKHDNNMLQLKIDAFKKDKALAKKMVLIDGAQAIMNILAGKATGNIILDAGIKAIQIAGVIATGAIQTATINAQAPPTAELGGIMDNSFFGSGGMVHGRSHAQGGEKFAVGGRVVELEGGEAVINKRSTARFKPILSKINQAGGGRKFADGGMVFNVDDMAEQNNVELAELIASSLNAQEVLLVESDVTQSQRTVETIETRATF